MPIRLTVRPDIANKLASLAEATGVSVDELLLEVINDLELAQGAASEPSLPEFEHDMDALAEGLKDSLVRYEGTYSREDIYRITTDAS